MLDQSRLTALLDCAAMLKMFVLFEGFDAEHLALMRDVLHARQGHEEQVLVGVNCRDLQKLTIEVPRLEELVEQLPQGFPRVAESGVTSHSDVERVVELGYSLALIGTTLMHSDDPARTLSEMLARGRQRATANRKEVDG